MLWLVVSMTSLVLSVNGVLNARQAKIVIYAWQSELQLCPCVDTSTEVNYCLGRFIIVALLQSTVLACAHVQLA